MTTTFLTHRTRTVDSRRGTPRGSAQRASAGAGAHAGMRARESITVATGFRDKAGNRASQYRSAIAAMQREGNYSGAAHEAKGWLLSELARVQRRRPQDAPAIYAEVTEKLAALAEALPFYKPTKTVKGGSHDGAA